MPARNPSKETAIYAAADETVVAEQGLGVVEGGTTAAARLAGQAADPRRGMQATNWYKYGARLRRSLREEEED